MDVPTLVAGVDSSTQSCKVVVRDADTGAPVRAGRANHPPGTEVDPGAWWSALATAVDRAGGLADVAALSVCAQQHGMVCLDGRGETVRPALLWNDTRSARAAVDLVGELGGGRAGRRAWARAVGSVPVASFTVTKLRWLADHEPASAGRTEAVCLPHDWLTWRLATGLPGGGESPGDGSADVTAIRTDRGDASGTGYWSPATGEYRLDLLRRALGRDTLVPPVLGPAEPAGHTPTGVVLGPGSGDNAGAVLGLGAGPGDVVVSIGTSGTACAVSGVAAGDPSGAVAGFADATGRFLPLVCTLNAAGVLDAMAGLLGVDPAGLDRLALSAPAGAGGVVVVPYLAGERTPDRPTATGAVHGLRPDTCTPAHLARAAVEGMLCGLADGVDALVAVGVRPERIVLVGGGSRSAAVRAIAPTVFGRPVVVPAAGEYVADGAARQAAWVLRGGPEPPAWPVPPAETVTADPVPAVRARYAETRHLTTG